MEIAMFVIIVLVLIALGVARRFLITAVVVSASNTAIPFRTRSPFLFGLVKVFTVIAFVVGLALVQVCFDLMLDAAVS